MWQADIIQTMKTKLCMGIFILAAALAQAQTNELTVLLQQGLFEEQANRNLDAAIASYQSLAAQFDKDRQLAATAVFRIGECYRMQGKTNEAAAQYQRILHDFSDQTALATLSRQNLTGMGVTTTHHFVESLAAIAARNPADANAEGVRQKQKELLEEQIKVVEQELHLQETRVKTGLLVPEATLSTQQKLLDLQRQLVALEGDQGVSPPMTAVSDEEAQEILRIKQMLQNSPDLINATLQGEDPLLVTAVRSGWMSATKLLLENGAILNPESPRRLTPLTAAAAGGNKGIVELLLSKGANINALDGVHGWAPLHYAVYYGLRTLAETLLGHGADVDVRSDDGNRPLHLAVDKGFTSLVELLLAHKADINAPGKGGETPLFEAIQGNRVEMVQFLISNKANVNFKTESGETPLLCAAGTKNINIAILKALLDSGADVEASAGGHHPLDLAINRGRADLVELLLQKNADPNARGRWTVAVEEGPGTWNYLDRMVTPLILAIPHNNPDGQSKIAEILLQHSANPDLTDEAGDTPLDYAIRNVNTNTIAELILHHADVNAPDRQGDPPLAYISRFVNDPLKQQQIKNMLIQAGANEDYQRRGGIFIAQKGTGSMGNKVFSKGTNSANRYTLFELIASAYGGQHGGHTGFPQGPNWGSPAIAFPDLAHITINRLKVNGSKEEIAVDLDEILKSGDCSKNPWLEWGDIVLIAELDHHVGEGWPGISQSERDTLGKCLMRKVKMVVKGQTTQFTLLPPIVGWYCYTAAGEPMGETWFQGGPCIISSSLAALLNGETILYSFDLHQVVHGANVLLISSDLSHVKVTRRESEAGGPPQVMEFNLETQPTPNVELKDGDVIEIPEREQK